MFTASFYLFHCVLNFVLKSAQKFIFRRKFRPRKNGNSKYKVATASSFKADCKLDDENGITFNPKVFIQRYLVASEIIRNHAADSSKLLKVIDFGCAEVSFVEYVKRIDGLNKVLCIDLDEDLLNRYHPRAKPLAYNYVCPRETPFSIDILAGSIADCDPCLLETDIVVCIELIEHLFPPDLNAVPWTVFGYIQPKIAIFTTPNVEFNVMFKDLQGFRHDDHKFEWTRKEFQDWAENIVSRYPNYEVQFSGIGPGPVGTERLGCCSQMAVFIRKGAVCEEDASIVETSKYKLIESYEYPFKVDSRTEAEKTRDEVNHHRIRLGYLEPYVDQDVQKIELKRLLPFVNQWCQSIEELKAVLESFGSVIETNENGDLCVIGMEDERRSDEEEEEGYLTGDLETENAFSDWGTYRASEQGDWPISPAWDATTVPDTDWDNWELSDSEPISQNRSLPPEHKTASDTLEAYPICEIDCEKGATEFETNHSVLTEKHDLQENSKPKGVLNKELIERNNAEKVRPPIELVDLTENDEAELTVSLTQTNDTASSVPSGNDENINATEGVWVISEELKYSKPHRRKYKKNKKRKSLESDGSEETRPNSSGSKPIKKRNYRKKGENRPFRNDKNADLCDSHKERSSISSKPNRKPSNKAEVPPSVIVTDTTNEHESNSALHLNKPHVDSKEKVDRTVTHEIAGSSSANERKVVESKDEINSAVSETDPKFSHMDKSGINLTTAFSDSVNNRPWKPKSVRRNRKRRSPLVSSETANVSSEKSQMSRDSGSRKYLSNSNMMTSNTKNICSLTNKTMKNDTRVLFPKKHNQDNVTGSTLGEEVRKKSGGNPFMSTIMKHCDGSSSVPGETSQDCSSKRSKSKPVKDS